MNYYIVFGLIVKSELELPELIPVNQTKEDITIRFGPVPNNLPKATFKGVLFEACPNKFLFRNEILSYYIKDGRVIWLQLNQDSLIQDIRLHILGTGLGVVLHQRGMIPIHGSAIAVNGLAYIFAGSSTSGKSSLAAAFSAKGYQVLSDDISVISKNEEDKFVVQPGIPHIKLWKDVLEELNFKDLSRKVRPELDKYIIANEISYCDNPLPIQAICMLNIKRKEGFEHTLIKGVDRFNYLRNNTFRIRILDSIGQTESHFQTISQLSNSIYLYEIERPQMPLNVIGLANYIERNIIMPYGKSE